MLQKIYNGENGRNREVSAMLESGNAVNKEREQSRGAESRRKRKHCSSNSSSGRKKLKDNRSRDAGAAREKGNEGILQQTDRTSLLPSPLPLSLHKTKKTTNEVWATEPNSTTLH